MIIFTEIVEEIRSKRFQDQWKLEQSEMLPDKRVDLHFLQTISMTMKSFNSHHDSLS